MAGLKLHEVMFRDEYVPQLVRMFPGIEVLYIWQGGPNEDDLHSSTSSSGTDISAGNGFSDSWSGLEGLEQHKEQEEKEERAALLAGTANDRGDGSSSRQQAGQLSWIRDSGLRAFAGLKRITYGEVRLAYTCTCVLHKPLRAGRLQPKFIQFNWAHFTYACVIVQLQVKLFVWHGCATSQLQHIEGPLLAMLYCGSGCACFMGEG